VGGAFSQGGKKIAAQISLLLNFQNQKRMQKMNEKYSDLSIFSIFLFYSELRMGTKERVLITTPK